MAKAVLDTTVFVDAVGADNEARHSAQHVLSAVLNGDVHAAISVETVHEAFWVLSRRPAGRAAALEVARWIASSYEVIATDEVVLRSALDNLQEYDSLSGIDAIILAGANAIGASALVTRDKGLGAASGALWVDPSDETALAEFLRLRQ